MNPYDRMFEPDPKNVGKQHKLHGLFDLEYSQRPKVRFLRLFTLLSAISVMGYFLRKLALDDPVVLLSMKQREEEHERLKKRSEMGVPISFDL